MEYDNTRKIVFLCDSTSVIAALDKIDTTSNVIREAKLALNKLSELTEIEVKWIKAHRGILGNEIADRAAKTGCNLPVTINIGVTKTHIKARINDIFYARWNKRWEESITCRKRSYLCQV